jgi:hypothetical protein
VARKEFAEYYGGYLEIFYVLCKGDFSKLKNFESMKTSEFLFLGEYLIRKRNVESMQ